MTRRVLTVLVVFAVLLGACGGDDDESGEEPDGNTDEPSDGFDPDARVKIGYDLESASRGGFTWDPSAVGTIASDLTLYQWVYGGLMRKTKDGSVEFDLAETAEVVDPNTIQVVLRDGLVTTDGTTVDSALVKTSLEHNLSLKDTTKAFMPAFFTLSTVEAVDAKTLRLTIPDGTAASWFDSFMAGVETVVVPPDTDFTMPAGAGPLMITDYEPGQTLALAKNPDYWDADAIQVAGVDFLNVRDPIAAVNALNGGQVEWARIEIPQVAALTAGKEPTSQANPAGVVNLGICKDGAAVPALAEPEVRQALSYAIDRDAVNEALFGGTGEPAWDLWPDGHPFHNPDLDEVYAYDPDQAKELLADAGYEDGFSFDVLVIQAIGLPDVAQVLQQEFAEIGVTMNIVPSPNYVEDRTNRKGQMGLVPVMGPGIAKLNQWTGPSQANWCQYNDPELTQLAADVAKVSAASDEAVDLWHQISEKAIQDDALSILIAFQPWLAGYDADRISGAEILGGDVLLPEIRDLRVNE